MKVMLTSCGIETNTIKECFLRFLDKPPCKARALFIPTAAVNADAIAVLPKCMEDLLKCGLPKENIRVFDLYKNMSRQEIQSFDVVYLCGGSTSHLLDRINETGFRNTLLSYIEADGFVIGVSAGSLIFAANLKDNLGLLNIKMNVHSKVSSIVGKVPYPMEDAVELSDTAAMLIRHIPNDIQIVDGAMV